MKPKWTRLIFVHLGLVFTVTEMASKSVECLYREIIFRVLGQCLVSGDLLLDIEFTSLNSVD